MLMVDTGSVLNMRRLLNDERCSIQVYSFKRQPVLCGHSHPPIHLWCHRRIEENWRDKVWPTSVYGRERWEPCMDVEREVGGMERWEPWIWKERWEP